jgi:hypothetical protein
MNYTRFALFTLIALVVLFVFLEGYVINPRELFVKWGRKKAYPSRAVVDKQIVPMAAPVCDWVVTHPNIHIYTLVFGGLGNTLMAYAAGCEASRRLGTRPPTLVVEPSGEFDFHNIPASKHGFHPSSVSEILPWANITVLNSMVNIATSLSDKHLWLAKDYEIPNKRSIVQVTNYEFVAEVSDESFSFIRESITREIYEYIQTHYGDLTRCMAVHLRMGQPTDWFAPPHPDAEDIISHYRRYNPERVLIFTDNRKLAEEVVNACELPNILWVGESAPIELVMIGMCSSAVISHSTFSVVGCRLFNRKEVRISMCEKQKHFQNIIDQSWDVIYKDVSYTTKVKNV